MTYTEKELDQFLHGISLSLLSKKSAQHWRYDEETAKEIEWLEALERKVRADKADRPQGEWENYKDEHRCSNCGEVVIGDWYDTYDWYDFCPYCGCRMKGADDENNKVR